MKSKNIIQLTFIFVVIAASLLLATAVSAQQSTPSDDEVNAIARQLYCPVCENTPLDVCPTTACHQWRELIRQMLAEGKSEAEIKQYFVDYYGARVLSEQPRTGINWVVYIVPPVAFLAGATLLFLAFRTWKRTAKEPVMETTDSFVPGSEPKAGKGSSKTLDDEYVARLEEELKKRK
jgi:cytochrome c-type biogenesis protein CcmH